nr:hypothetical protein [Tanacetum cinerariifolium]
MLMSQEKEASDVADAYRQEFEQGCIDQRGVTNYGSTNNFKTFSHPVNDASTSRTFSAAGPSSPYPDAFIPANTLLHVDQDDSQIPDLEDTAELQSIGIFNSAYDDDLDIFDSPVQSVGAEANFNNMESSTIVSPIPTHRVHLDHPKDQILGDPKLAVQTRGMVKKSFRAHALMEPKKVSQALDDASWVEAMQEELLQFSLQKKTKRGIVVKNKAMLVAQGHRQEEGIDYDQVFDHVAWIEAIGIFLAFVSYMGFIVYQMDVKSAVLYGIIEEEVYVCQTPGFIDSQFPNKVYKVEKALYGLHQAPRAWYETLSTFLLQHRYRKGTIDKNLFIKKDKDDIMLVQVYVDDIIFGFTKKSLCDEFEALMHRRFQMSSMRELTFFLGLQVKQSEEGIFISQDTYVAQILKKFDFSSVKTTSTPIETHKPLVKDKEATDVDVHLYRSMIGSLMYLTASRLDIMFAVCACSRFQVTPKLTHLYVVKRIFRYLKGQPKLGLWYHRDSPFDLEAYLDSDYAGANLDRKFTTRGCQFLGRRLISWQCKKQTIVATSTTEAEYVAAANYCRQIFWIQNQMLDYGFNFMNTKIYIDNESTICIVKNPVYHSKTKHIEIRHHFIMDSYEKKLIQVLKIYTDDNVDDLLTKASDASDAVYYDLEGILLINQSLNADLKFVDRHNMVACLEGTKANDDFHQIVDFLSTCLISYALTVSPTIYASYIEQFWNTSTSKIVNSVKQIHAIVDGKAVVISESSVRSDLLFNDEDGDTDTQTRFETASKQSHDLPLSEVNTSRSGEDSLEHQDDLTDGSCLRGSKDYSRQSDYQIKIESQEARSRSGEDSLEHQDDLTDEVKTTQDKVITRLKLRVKRLDKKKKARTSQSMKRRLFKGRVKTSTDKSLEVLVEDKGSSEKGGSTTDQVSTARLEVSTATPSTLPTTTTIFGDEDLTIAQTLIKLRSKKAKEKGVAFRDVEEPSKLTRSTTTLQPLLTIDPKDKELAQRIYEEELAELDRAQKERQRQEEATIPALTKDFDKIQAIMDADHGLTIRMTHEEADAIRNKPPTRTQVKNMMITYLKIMGKYTHQQLKHNTFNELQKLYQKEQKWIDDFVLMNSEKEEKKSVEPESKGKKVVLDEEETVDLEILSTKYLIVDWESQNLGNVEDEIWSNQQDWNLISRKLYENYEVHTLLIDGTLNYFNLLVEKRYPLIKKILEKMLNWKLEAKAESTMAFELLKFINSQVEE